MTLTPPTVIPVSVSQATTVFRAAQDIQPFSYRSTMTYGELLQEMRTWLYNTLVPYLNTNFEDITESWVDNITSIDASINLALSQQADAINAALSTQQQEVADSLAATLNAITQGESAALNDSAVYNALQVANSQALALLDGRYVRKGDTLVLNDLPGFKADGSADMSSIINTAIAALPTGQTNIVILPTANGKTKVRIDSTITIDIGKGGLSCPRGGVEFDASHMTTGAAIQVRSTVNVANNVSVSGPVIGPFKLTGPGSAVAGSIGILYHEPVSANTGGQIRQLRTVDVSIALFETGVQFGDNVYNIVHDNCVIKGFNKYGVWFPSTTNNSGERLVFTNCVIQEGYGGTSVAIQNDGTASIFYYHGSIDYVNGYFVNNTASGRLEFHSTHFERYVTTATTPWFVMSAGAMKFYGGLITATGAYASNTAPVSLFSNTASPTFTDGLLLIDGTTFGNSLQISSNYLVSGTGNVIARNTNRQNQFQQAFLHSSAVANLCTPQSTAMFLDKWFLDDDTGTRTAAQRTRSSVTGNNGTLTIQNTVKKSNAYAVQLLKTGGALSVFEAALAVPIDHQQSAAVSLWLARAGTANGTFTLTFRFATVIDDPISPRVGQSLNMYSLNITPQTDWATANTFYQYVSNTGVQRAPAWATHVVIYFECYNLGANTAIVIADPVVTEF